MADPDEKGGSGRGGGFRFPNPFDRSGPLREIAGIIPDGYEQIDEFHWVNPDSGRVYRLAQDKDGAPILDEWSEGDSKRFLASRGIDLDRINGPSQRLVSDDPRYWDVQYRQLEQELINSGLDAESARRQALATIITNRNAQSVALANASADAAKTGAEFAANPRDSFSDLLYREAIGGQNVYGNNQDPAFKQMQTGLENRFTELFGNVGGDLSRAREFVSAPTPSEFLSPQLSIPKPSLVGQGAATPAGGVPAPSLEDQTRIRQAYAQNPQQAEDFFRMVTELNNGVPPTTAEDGVNMNIMEPAMVIGKSGKVYATMAESDAEQLIVKPLPSVKERKKKEKESASNFMKMTEGATRMAHGGTATALPDFSKMLELIRESLNPLGGSGGGVGAYQGALPDPRLLAGEPARRLGEDPRLQDYVHAGYSTEEGGGLDSRDVDAIVKRYTPNSARRYSESSLPRVNFA